MEKEDLSIKQQELLNKLLLTKEKEFVFYKNLFDSFIKKDKKNIDVLHKLFITSLNKNKFLTIFEKIYIYKNIVNDDNKINLISNILNILTLKDIKKIEENLNNNILYKKILIELFKSKNINFEQNNNKVKFSANIYYIKKYEISQRAALIFYKNFECDLINKIYFDDLYFLNIEFNINKFNVQHLSELNSFFINEFKKNSTNLFLIL